MSHPVSLGWDLRLPTPNICGVLPEGMCHFQRCVSFSCPHFLVRKQNTSNFSLGEHVTFSSVWGIMPLPLACLPFCESMMGEHTLPPIAGDADAFRPWEGPKPGKGSDPNMISGYIIMP